ncbi:hypothetical protein D4639_000218 [Escherichia coli]|uniref:hypothetical protein n=1 Tax=Escherichia TaxID=561 RepID=UPI00096A33BB|nr:MULTISPECIES: hypothetical protein [Escherichia]HDQ6568172.1 hypothetical protein [Escherichia coli Ou:H7]EEC7658554.1 hypothetical protein [Escherichia coli]EET2568064.1 hypothetical protein [Escherichia coli]EEW8233491.1 hypothetical protein [Escherichia coli]EGO9203323.1 hypothetical protein [Escherichia coli]
MTRKLKPLSRGERAVIWRLAHCLVLADIEQNAIARAYEQQTGKPWNPDAPDTPMKRLLRSSPACARLWKLLGKDIRSVREEIYAGLKTPGTEDGGRREP